MFIKVLYNFVQKKIDAICILRMLAYSWLTLIYYKNGNYEKNSNKVSMSLNRYSTVVNISDCNQIYFLY